VSRRRWSIWAATLLLALPIVSIASPAYAGPEPDLRLMGQDPWTRIGSELRLRVRIRGEEAGFTLAVITHDSVDNFEEFQQTANGEELGQTHDIVRIPIELFPPDQAGERSVSVGLEDVRNGDLTNRLGAPGEGVYPLEVELRDQNDETRARFVTYLVVESPAGEPSVIDEPLGVAWVWPLVTRPTLRADSTPDPEIVDVFKSSGRLGRQVRSLARARDVPVTLAPTPETVQSWITLAEDDESLADGAEQLRSLGLNAQVLSGPYVAVNIPSLLRAGMAGAVDRQLIEGGRVLETVFENADTSTALVTPVDAATLGRLSAGRRVDRVVIDESSLVERESELTPVRPFRLDAPALVADSEVNALAADGALADLLTGDAAAALRAQRFLAALSVIAFEPTATGIESEPRGIAVVNRRGFDVPTAVIDAAFAGLRDHPWLRPMQVDDIFDSVEAATTEDGSLLVRELADTNPAPPPVTQNDYSAAELRLAAFEDFAPGAAGTTWARRALLSSVSSDWEGPKLNEGRARLDAINDVVDGFASRINVPAPSTITLTDRSGDIPLTVRNATGQPVQVEIVLQSPKLSFPEGSQQVITLPRRNTTVRFAVESRTSGSFPLRLTVRSVGGAITIAEARFRVEATAVSIVGLILIISAVVFLAAWWLIHIRRERHRKRRRLRQPVPVT
jgi:hypothetical protein